METKFCTVTRCDRELYKEILKIEGWKLNLFRRYSMTCSILLIVFLAAVHTFLLSRNSGGVMADHARTFFIFGGIMSAAAFILECKTSAKRMEKALDIKAVQKLRQSGKTEGEKEEIHWYEDFCEIETEEVTSRYQYTGLRRIEEGKKYIFVTFGGNVLVTVDREEFRKGKPEKFKKFLEGKWKN